MTHVGQSNYPVGLPRAVEKLQQGDVIAIKQLQGVTVLQLAQLFRCRPAVISAVHGQNRLQGVARGRIGEAEEEGICKQCWTSAQDLAVTFLDKNQSPSAASGFPELLKAPQTQSKPLVTESRIARLHAQACYLSIIINLNSVKRNAENCKSH